MRGLSWDSDLHRPIHELHRFTGKVEHFPHLRGNRSSLREVNDEIGHALAADEIGENSIELLAADRVQLVVNSNHNGSANGDRHV